MRKKLSIAFAIMFVLCFGTLTFAQNSNGGGTMSGGRHHRHHRHHHRHHRHHHNSAKTGNANKH